MYHIAGWIIAGLVGAAIGGAVVYFWDDLKEWANRMLGYILDAIDWALQKASDAITYIVTRAGRYYREIRVWIKNRRTGKVVVESRTEQVDRDEIPVDIQRQLGMNDEKEVMRTPIRN
jgi:hypothetical protein